MLQAQISDIQFYLMKINRLEVDLAATQEELMAARLRLRTAEDYQIKYELLMKQTQQESSRMKLYEREEQQKIAELITLKLQDRDKFWSEKVTKIERDLHEKYSKQYEKLCEEFSNFKKRHEKCGNKIQDQDILAFKNKKLQKENEALEEKIAEMRRDYQKGKQQQVKQIKQALEEKNREKQDNERKIYRQKIETLEKTIQNLENNLLEAKVKADPNRQNEIQRLRNQLNNQMNKSNQELQKISLAFREKSAEIEHLLQEKYKAEEGLIGQKKELRAYMKTLQDKIYQKQKEHEIQLIHLKQRMSKIREQEVEELKNQLLKIQESFKQERESWTIVINDKDKELERMKNKFEEDRQRHKDDKEKQLNKISQLKERLREYQGEREAGQTELLLKSMKDVQAKEADFSNYENGVTFLDRQLKKAMSKIEQKNIQITNLIKQLSNVRKQLENEIDGLKEKARKDKKYYTDKIYQLEEEIKDLHELLRNKEKQHKKKEKDYQSKIAQIEKENQSLKDLNEELHKDYKRAVENKKAVQNSYREERQRGITSKSDLTMAKKQKWLQIERQKSELEAIFKERQEQLKNKHEVETERLRHERDQLRNENELLKGLVQSGKKDNPDQNKENRDNLYAEYHKKMATIDLEIALTKNIYDSLIQAKSRRTKQAKEMKPLSEYDRVELTESQLLKSQQNQSPLKDSRVPYSPADIERLGMSFNPNRK